MFERQHLSATGDTATAGLELGAANRCPRQNPLVGGTSLPAAKIWAKKCSKMTKLELSGMVPGTLTETARLAIFERSEQSEGRPMQCAATCCGDASTGFSSKRLNEFEIDTDFLFASLPCVSQLSKLGAGPRTCRQSTGS